MSRCLVVEDSRLARQDLVAELRRLRLFTEVLEAESAEAARGQLRASGGVDVLFLDIHLPGESGFDLLESLDVVPPVIFTTAHEQYALRAFDFDTVDYLVKPIREERLAKSLAKLRLGQAGPGRERLLVRDGERSLLVEIAEVWRIESIGNYVRLYAGARRLLMHRALTRLEEVLPKGQFYRVSRSELIGLAHVRSISDAGDGGAVVHLLNGEQLSVSRRRLAGLREKLGDQSASGFNDSEKLL